MYGLPSVKLLLAAWPWHTTNAAPTSCSSWSCSGTLHVAAVQTVWPQSAGLASPGEGGGARAKDVQNPTWLTVLMGTPPPGR